MLPKSSVALGHSLRTDHGNSATPRNQGDQTTSRPTTDFSAVPCILAGVMCHLWFFSAVMAALSNSGMPLEYDFRIQHGSIDADGHQYGCNSSGLRRNSRRIVRRVHLHHARPKLRPLQRVQRDAPGDDCTIPAGDRLAAEDNRFVTPVTIDGVNRSAVEPRGTAGTGYRHIIDGAIDVDSKVEHHIARFSIHPGEERVIVRIDGVIV